MGKASTGQQECICQRWSQIYSTKCWPLKCYSCLQRGASTPNSQSSYRNREDLGWKFDKEWKARMATSHRAVYQWKAGTYLSPGKKKICLPCSDMNLVSVIILCRNVWYVYRVAAFYYASVLLSRGFQLSVRMSLPFSCTWYLRIALSTSCERDISWTWYIIWTPRYL